MNPTVCSPPVMLRRRGEFKWLRIDRMCSNRRDFLRYFAASWGGGVVFPAETLAVENPSPAFGAETLFDFDQLIDRARAIARLPYVEPAIVDASILEKIDYSNHAKIWFLEKYGLWRADDEPGPVHFFHPGKFFKDPVRVHLVENGSAREVLPSPEAFGYPWDHPGRDLTRPPAFAGFKVLNKGTFTDWLSFVGKSYFRSSGPLDQYGLSARGVLLDAGLSTKEEFPRFSEFWLDDRDEGFTIYALLEGESLTGAYRFVCQRAEQTDMEIEAHLYARNDITRLGIAPLTSMYWYGENDRRNAVDWRPEIHDSDGLLMKNGAGETLWRPLNNPPRVMTNAFADATPRGFGLMQRDRTPASYSDPGLNYHKRPSAWVTPLNDWGKGAVQLIEIPTDDEIHDNIGAYWVSDLPVKQGDERTYSYRLSWVTEAAGISHSERQPARVVSTRSGIGGVPEQPRPVATRRFVVDFEHSSGLDVSENELPLVSLPATL